MNGRGWPSVQGVSILGLFPWLTGAVFLVPVCGGLLGALLPAFDYLPVLGRAEFSLRPWRELFAQPGVTDSLRITVFTGFAATALSLALALGLLASPVAARFLARKSALLSFFLATPHAAQAVGLAFLLAPSGWLSRLASPWLTGWTRPPDVSLIGDPWGVSLVFGLVLKEVPYLVFMGLAALPRIQAERLIRSARALGYGPAAAFCKVVLPRLYPLLRLPVYAVLVFSLSTVDVAMLLGPSVKPTLAVALMRLFTDRDLGLHFPAAAGAMLLLGVCAAAVLAWRAGEAVVGRFGRMVVSSGQRRADGGPERLLLGLACAPAMLGALMCAASLAGLAVWSLAGAWRFPEPLPEWSLGVWMRAGPEMLRPGWTTLVAGLGASVVAAVLATGCLENEARGRRAAAMPGRTSRSLWLLYLPLLIPQIAFLFGAQTALIRLGVDGNVIAVVASHLLFTLPYVFLSLADPWRDYDPRWRRVAAGLGIGPARFFWRIKLPMLAGPVFTALAVGFAVSVAMYLPTVFAGAGRVATLTTEAVTLASGGDRRLAAAYAFAQSVLPLAGYGLAAALPAWLHRNRRGMRGWR